MPSGNLPPFATVILVDQNQTSVSVAWLKKTIDWARVNDDVICEEFLQGIILVSTVEQVVEIDTSPGVLQQMGISWTHVCKKHKALQLRPGPYKITDRKIAPIYRIFDDTNGAFLHSLFAVPPR